MHSPTVPALSEITATTIATALQNYRTRHNASITQCAIAGNVPAEIMEKILAGETVAGISSQFVLVRMVPKLAPELTKQYNLYAPYHFIAEYQTKQQVVQPDRIEPVAQPSVPPKVRPPRQPVSRTGKDHGSESLPAKEDRIALTIPPGRHAYRFPVIADAEWHKREKSGSRFVKRLVEIAKSQHLTMKNFIHRLDEAGEALRNARQPIADLGATYNHTRIDLMRYGANEVSLGLVQRAAWVLFQESGDFTEKRDFETLTDKVWNHSLERSFAAQVRKDASPSRETAKLRPSPVRSATGVQPKTDIVRPVAPKKGEIVAPRIEVEKAVGIWIANHVANGDWMGFSFQINRQLKPDQWVHTNQLKSLAHKEKHDPVPLTIEQKRGFAQLMVGKDVSSMSQQELDEVIMQATRTLGDRRLTSRVPFTSPNGQVIG